MNTEFRYSDDIYEIAYEIYKNKQILNNYYRCLSFNIYKISLDFYGDVGGELSEAILELRKCKIDKLKINAKM
jgi:hypothetical protein